VEVLNNIYETDFLGFTYGFRPKRSQHKALDALWYGLDERCVNWVLDLDVRSFFDRLSHEWLVQFLQHRIADRRVVRLIQKWLNAGVLERASERSRRQVRRRAEVHRRCWRISISTTSSISGFKHGVRSVRMAM
jgi:retron-type reverse transcriptase